MFTKDLAPRDQRAEFGGEGDYWAGGYGLSEVKDLSRYSAQGIKITAEVDIQGGRGVRSSLKSIVNQAGRERTLSFLLSEIAFLCSSIARIQRYAKTVNVVRACISSIAVQSC